MSSKLLIISFDALPYSPTFGSAARVTYLYRFLRDKNHECYCLSVSGRKFGFFGHDDLCMEDFTFVRSRLKSAKQNAFDSAIHRKGGRLRRAGRNFLSLLNRSLFIPDYSVVSVFALYRKARVIVESRSIDTVVVSAPPHGVNLVAALLKIRFPHIRVILEYRDSWNTQPIFKMKNWVGARAAMALEKFILKKIDHLVYVSPIVPALLKDQLSISVDGKSSLIMNGFVAPRGLEYVPRRLVKDDLRLAYFGVINDFDDSYRSIIFANRLTLSSYGSVNLDIYGHVELTSFDLSSNKKINVVGKVNHDEVFRLTQKYDALVLLHTDYDSSLEPIPGKFFDYLLARRPIVCIMPEASIVSKLITDNCLGVVINPLDVESTCVISKLRGLKFNDSFDLGSFSREHQFEKYLPLINWRD